MKLPYSWLVELTGSKWPAEEMGDRLTLCGTACEDIEPTARYFDKVVVGKVLDIKRIPGADKIRQATVDIGKEKLYLVCGAPIRISNQARKYQSLQLVPNLPAV